ncbi:N-6 DNA methylase [Microbispora sp. SCL1-1]|uniref:methylation-associated defense system DNA methyltransferase MAD2 n=1 Tax=unclassified Microbispora TaxID=2614687 RepID=UPI00115A37C1|nr:MULTISPECIES: N-6 DNA methylase [unclassified Microbispora]NJP29903.1 N-6 DNA methylase [Microbispora sp. CL1-1]TQS03806.1 N-6 DNA methylase [Microbispora sp. SCL1-1]
MEQVGLEIGQLDEGEKVEPDALADDEDIDFITGKRIKLKGNEPVRQAVALALAYEYRIPVEDMERDYPIPVDVVGKRRGSKKADIAIFEHGKPHTLDNLRRVVVCKPQPKLGRSVTKLRTFQQAAKDLEELEELLGTEATPQIRYGMWTNGVDQFFLHKSTSRFGATFEQLPYWPVAEETDEELSGARPSVGRFRLGEAGALKTAFRRCHNYIHGNEGMPKDAAFWQFLYLLFAKMHDEKVSRRNGTPPEFYALPREHNDEAGRKAIRERVLQLFDVVKKEYDVFSARDEITLSDRAIAFIVGELGSYNLSGTDADVKGLAYQELVGTNLRGDRGQYFTPRNAVEFMVDILDPQEDETVLDPCCGTGGFLRETLRHLLDKWREREGTAGQPDTVEQLDQHQERLRDYADRHLFGADFDPFLVRAASMSVMMLSGAPGNTFHMDSLAFPEGHLSGVAPANEKISLGTVDVVLTNPPFGTDIKIEDKDILDQYRDGVAQSWSRNRETGELVTTGSANAMSPEQLFVQRAVQWVREGGRVGIVLPNGILSNPGPADEAIRRWILKNCWVLASVELPVEAFIHEAGVNILTTLLFLKRKTRNEIIDETMSGKQQDYPVFMAVAEKVGIDRRGNKVYRRHPDGEIIAEADPNEEPRTWVRNGEVITIPPRRRKLIDNDLPEIARAYKRFRERYPEPGGPR